MSVFYKLAQNSIKDSKVNGKWFAHTAVVGTVDLNYISELIQRNCSMKRSDVNAVLTELPEVMRDMLQHGYRVKVNGLGAFKIGIRSKGTDSVGEFNAREHIVNARVVFQPEQEYDAATGNRTKYLTRGVSFADINTMAAKAALDAKEQEKQDQSEPIEP